MTDQETIQKLKNYEGDNGFIKSVLNGYNRWGKLTPKQLDAVKKFFTPKKSKNTIDPIKINVDLVLKRYGKAEPIDEKSKDGNFVKIDFEGFLNEEKFEGGEAQDYSLELGSKTMIPGFEEQIIGMKASETKEIEVTFPEDYQAENLKGQKVLFKIKMKNAYTVF